MELKSIACSVAQQLWQCSFTKTQCYVRTQGTQGRFYAARIVRGSGLTLLSAEITNQTKPMKLLE